MVRSVRLQLTLWYALLLGVTLIAFLLGFYAVLRDRLLDQLDDGINNRASILLDLIPQDGAADLPPGLGADLEEPLEAEVFLRIFNLLGEVIYDNSPSFGEVPIDRASIAQAAAGAKSYRTLGSDDEARILTVPVTRNGAIVSVLQVGESTEDVREILDFLLLVVGLTVPLCLLFAGVGGWWLSSRALKPIDRITRAAQEISSAGDLSRRLNLELPDDEVGRLARTFDEMLARLEAAFQRQREFTADASHELRTPLTAVRGQIEVALERPRDAAEYQRVLTGVNEQVDRMTRLVNGLLSLARSDAGDIVLNREPIHLGDLVTSVAEHIRPLAQLKGLDIEIEGSGDLVADVDEDLVLQLVLNLADNAVRYTRDGQVTLGWRQTPQPELFVRDTGPGIPAQHREKVFSRFYRVDVSRSGLDGGAGLGLSISRWIAEAHGGALTLHSSSEGSTFTFRLSAT